MCADPDFETKIEEYLDEDIYDDPDFEIFSDHDTDSEQEPLGDENGEEKI